MTTDESAIVVASKGQVEEKAEAPAPAKQEAVAAGSDGDGQPPSAPMGMGSGNGQPSPATAMGVGGGMAPGPGMGYPSYQLGPYAFPPQPPMIPPMPIGGGMLHPPHGPYAAAAPMPGMMMPPGPSAPPERQRPGGGGTAVCIAHFPGMPRAFEVPFPERKLPVCDRCKKNYRSRELCRQRDGHRALPWQSAYVVVTLSDEVLEKGSGGGNSLTYADIPVTAELQQIPEMCRGPADGCMAKEPICKVCKERNYTRDHCRNTLRHTTPPYQCVYVKLVPSPPDEADNRLRPAKRKKKKQEENADGHPRPDPNTLDQEEEDKSDDLTEIHPSKTFFATISSKKIFVKWCEQIRFPEAAEAALQPTIAPSAGFMMPPYMNMPGNPNMQYQMWDAFRAGAMWAQSQAAHGGHVQMPPGYGVTKYAPPNATSGGKNEMV